jgi:hypothetical protein
VRYAIAMPVATRRLWVLTRDDDELGTYASIEPAITHALQQLRADRKHGRDAELFVNGVEVIVRQSAAVAA